MTNNLIYESYYEPVLTKFQLKVGDIVHSENFGVGKIISQRGDKEIVTINFEDYGEKNIRVEVGNLKVLRSQKDEKIEPRVRWFKAGKLSESYFTGRGGDLEGLAKKLKNKIGHDFEIKDDKLYFLASEDEETERELQSIAKDFGVKIKLEKMNNLKDFDTFNEEYMYRQGAENKEERHAKSKEWFIGKLVSKGFKKDDLQKMSIAELGRKWNNVKKEK